MESFNTSFDNFIQSVQQINEPGKAQPTKPALTDTKILGLAKEYFKGLEAAFQKTSHHEIRAAVFEKMQTLSKTISNFSQIRVRQQASAGVFQKIFGPSKKELEKLPQEMQTTLTNLQAKLTESEIMDKAKKMISFLEKEYNQIKSDFEKPATTPEQRRSHLQSMKRLSKEIGETVPRLMQGIPEGGKWKDLYVGRQFQQQLDRIHVLQQEANVECTRMQHRIPATIPPPPVPPRPAPAQAAPKMPKGPRPLLSAAEGLSQPKVERAPLKATASRELIQKAREQLKFLSLQKGVNSDPKIKSQQQQLRELLTSEKERYRFILESKPRMEELSKRKKNLTPNEHHELQALAKDWNRLQVSHRLLLSKVNEKLI